MPLIAAGTTQYLIHANNTTYTLGKGLTRSASGTDSAIMAPFGYHGDKVVIFGTVTQTDDATFAVSLSGTGMTFQVAGGGRVTGNSGVEFTGAGARLNNYGIIESDAAYGYGLLAEGATTTVINAGVINVSRSFGSAILATGDNIVINNAFTLQGGYGINIAGSKATISIGSNGLVVGRDVAIYSTNTDAADSVRVTNNGQIIGETDNHAIQLGASNDRVVNHGKIFGTINLGAGNDLFDNRGGTVDHAIVGGAGNDTLITTKAFVKLSEAANGGFDTIKSSVSYTLPANVEYLALFGNANISGKGTNTANYLVGNAGNNHLYGLSGNDYLDGGKGNDVLVGGAGNDVFVFGKGDGHDTIMDFGLGNDGISLAGWTGIDSFADVKSHWSQHGADLWISSGSDVLILHDTVKADLRALDFSF